jgi:phosphoribosylformylglycinamidine synthase
MSKVFRYYAEKSAKHIEVELNKALGIKSGVRMFIRYDIQDLEFPDPHVLDITHKEQLPEFEAGAFLLHVEPVDGQFDAVGEVCEIAVQLLSGGTRPKVKTAIVYAFSGISEAEFNRVSSYLINPLEYKTACTKKPSTLIEPEITELEKIPTVDLACNDVKSLGLAMSSEDLDMVREYFKGENRNPTLTEILVLDTYWSDHCRHTTFNTIVKKADITDNRVKKAFEQFKSVNGERPVTLMNIAVAAMRSFRNHGKLPMLDESDEINACTIKVDDNYLFFKNETHNHPTEIEPFGGASTCIGGGIRDPLSGRANVYQGMRITGAGDPRQDVKDTLEGKLPQRKLTLTAAEGFSSYANQIGAATGFVREIYHDGYVAKRMEAGALVASAPMSSVKREKPIAGDKVLLLGARTGRDGVGGATGSSVTHDKDTVNKASCEVQKGNPPEERRIQRLFRRKEATILIKKCNDFGAGGVSVAVGELADGLEIELDKVPQKAISNNGLNGTEIAISESQERMAVVIADSDVSKMLSLCEEEGVEATVIATVTDTPRLVMHHKGQTIVDVSREFLDTNGAKRYTEVKVVNKNNADYTPLDINLCSQKGLVERFDSSVGGGSVFMPFGGKYQLSQTQVMAHIIPDFVAVNTAEGSQASVMSYGFDPHLTEADPFGGSAHAIVVSVAKLIAVGADIETIHLSLQEFFPRVDDVNGNSVPERWGLPFAAMLGAFSAQMGLEIAAIGGKDSMSGSFGEKDIPPTLISFAVGVGDAKALISPEFKGAGNPVYVLNTPTTSGGLPNYEKLKSMWKKYSALVKGGKVLSAHVYENAMTAPCIVNMALGNMVGFVYNETFKQTTDLKWGSIVFEATEKLDGFEGLELLGETRSEPEIVYGNFITQLSQICEEWKTPLSSVFPVSEESVINTETQSQTIEFQSSKIKAVIPVLPGTTGEYDIASAIEQVGGSAQQILIRNLTPALLQESIDELEKAIEASSMLVLPGGSESADLIVALLVNPRLSKAVSELISRDGLVLGIGDGFKALVKLGLLGGNVGRFEMNKSGRYCHRYVETKAVQTNSPWLSQIKAGEVYVQPISHIERFVPCEELPASQIVFRLADCVDGIDGEVEAVVSPCGRVLGKMGHFERYNEFTARNIPGNQYVPLFEGAMRCLSNK